MEVRAEADQFLENNDIVPSMWPTYTIILIGLFVMFRLLGVVALAYKARSFLGGARVAAIVGSLVQHLIRRSILVYRDGSRIEQYSRSSQPIESDDGDAADAT